MHRIFKNLIVIIPVILSMAACAQLDRRPRDYDLDKNLQRIATFSKGKRLNNIKVKEEGDNDVEVIDHIINLVGGEGKFDDTLRDDLKRLRQQKRLVIELRKFVNSLEDEEITYEGALPEQALRRRLRGLGGFHSILALRTLTECVIEGKEQLLSVGQQRLLGKIFLYSYNRYSSGGFIGFGANHILTCKEGKRPIENNYIIHVAIIPYDQQGNQIGFREFRKKNGKFPEEIAQFLPNDRDVQRRIKARGLNRKLYARGESIKVIAAFKDKKLLPKHHPIYHQDEDSCIDILFKDSIPTYELPDQEDYCMGRCGSPPLVNTGY